MTDIFSHADTSRLARYQSILAEAGIRCEVRPAAIDPTEPDRLPLPTIAVSDDEQVPEALRILREFEAEGMTDAPDWKCAKCGEEIPATFDSCWHCQAPRPE
jgi:hypothetical protein